MLKNIIKSVRTINLSILDFKVLKFFKSLSLYRTINLSILDFKAHLVTPGKDKTLL